MYDSPSSPEERLANWNVCLMILRIKGVAFNEASSEDLSNGDAEVLKQFLDHLMSVQSALSDVSVVTSSPAASVFSEASSGVIRFVYGKEAFLVPYADSASITIGALVGEVLVKVGKERLDIVVTYMSGKPCDVNSIVKDVLALNGGSSSFKLEDRK